MTTPLAPRLLKAGLVLLDADRGAVARVLVLQYNPDTLTRTLQPLGGDADRAEPLRLKGPPVETFKLDAELDATDQLAEPAANPAAVSYGLQPQLAALETVLYPTSARLAEIERLAAAGTLEIAPAEGPLVLFVWSRQRVVPVRVTDCTVTEDAFDADLNPIRAKVSLGLRVLSVNDFPAAHRGASLFLGYLRTKERLAGLGPAGALATLGLQGIP